MIVANGTIIETTIQNNASFGNGRQAKFTVKVFITSLNRKHCIWQTVDTFGSAGLHIDVVRFDRRKTFSTRTFPSVVHRRRHLEVRRARVDPRKCEFETL